MPSPFPGMDPYLEDRSIWPDVHSSLISYIREELQPQVRPKYIARIGERIEVAHRASSYVPDVMIVQPPRNPSRSVTAGAMMMADEPVTFYRLDEELHIPYIEIVYRDTGDIVTVIEVLSPANKAGVGRAQYLQKQNDLIDSQVNLVEIDLLSQGQPTVAARSVTVTTPPNWRYMVSTSRMVDRLIIEVYAFALADRLPRCRIPLRAADPDVVLDLPVVFTRCYDVGGYDLLVDYNKAPPVPLSEEEAAWMAEHLQSIKGNRILAE